MGIAGLSTPFGGISIPDIVRFDITAPNVEESYIFTGETKQIRIFNDGNVVLRYAYAPTETNTNYYPIYPHDEFFITGISTPSFTIYLQSSKIIPISIEYWR